MAGYLEQYGAGEELHARRIKIIKRTLISLLTLAVVGGILLFVFHNYREEQRVRQFYSFLGAKDYKSAYALFGCTDTTPCRYYGFDQFMRDWGPNSGHDDVSNVRIARSRSCGSGVLLTVDYGRQQQEKLWVERKDMSIGFPPVQGCPAGM
ncbi:MAG TPA: hypothetical protein VMJ75_01265 [Candidatus Acidoferrales bacterium]|nr:hypothetical protein [Candidatus Acidoferrales bacterium]